MPCVRECTYTCVTESGRQIELTLLQTEQTRRNPCRASVTDSRLGSCRLTSERVIPGSLREVAQFAGAGALIGGGIGFFFFGPKGAVIGAVAGFVVGGVLSFLNTRCP